MFKKIDKKLLSIVSTQSNQNNEIEFGFKTDYTRYKKHTEVEGNARFTATNTGFYLGYNFKF